MPTKRPVTRKSPTLRKSIAMVVVAPVLELGGQMRSFIVRTAAEIRRRRLAAACVIVLVGCTVASRLLVG